MSNELQVIEHKLNKLEELIKVQSNTRLSDSLFSPQLAPHYSKLAESLCQSNVIPKCYIGKPTDAFIAMELGYQLGMSIAQSLQDIAVINGRPCVWGDGMLAICMRHPDFEDIIEEYTYEGDVAVIAHCTVKRRGFSAHKVQYSLKDAQKAKLLSKPGAWQTDTARMLRMRARAFALRDRFADALKGLSSAEEVIYTNVNSSEKDSEQTGTRTEVLKADYKQKTGKTYDNGMDTQIPDETIDSSNEPIENSEIICEKQDAETDNREPDSEVIKENVEDRQINKKEILELEAQFKIMQFDKDRKENVLKYYGVKQVKELTISHFHHLNSQLEKMRNKDAK